MKAAALIVVLGLAAAAAAVTTQGTLNDRLIQNPVFLLLLISDRAGPLCLLLCVMG